MARPTPLSSRLLRAACGLLAVLTLASAGVRLTADDPNDKKARLKNLAVEVEGQKVFVSCELVGAVDEKLRQRIESGLATGIVFDFELVRIRKGWFDKNVESGEVQVIVMYNAVSREYLVNTKYDGDLVESRVVRDAEELYKVLTTIDRLEVFSLEGRPPAELQVRGRAELGTGSILFFIPTIRATDWIESERFKVDKNGKPETPPEDEKPAAEDPGTPSDTPSSDQGP